ncbi:hypothetical protein Dimus_024446 [Dionaea muscipula]
MMYFAVDAECHSLLLHFCYSWLMFFMCDFGVEKEKCDFGISVLFYVFHRLWVQGLSVIHGSLLPETLFSLHLEAEVVRGSSWSELIISYLCPCNLYMLMISQSDVFGVLSK